MRMFLRESDRVWCGMRRYSSSRITEGSSTVRRVEWTACGVTSSADAQPLEWPAATRAECATHIFTPLGIGQAGLGAGGSNPADRVQQRDTPAPGNVFRQDRGLIESSLEAPPPMQRHRRHRVKPVIEWK